MVNLTNLIETADIYSYLILGSILLITIILYVRSKKIKKNFILSITFFMLSFIIFPFISFPYNLVNLVIMIGSIYYILSHKCFSYLFVVEDNKIFANKPPQIWDTMKNPPEIKIKRESEEDK